MSVKGGRYGQAGKLIKEAQEYDFSCNDELVSSALRHVYVRTELGRICCSLRLILFLSTYRHWRVDQA